MHPSTYRSGQAVPLGQSALDRWYQLVAALGGTVHHAYEREVGGLTFSPVTLELTQSRQLAGFNPLRALRPMPTIRPRPRFGARSNIRIRPPVDPAPISVVTTVAVFDGGTHTADPALFPIRTTDLVTEPSDSDDQQHGIGVTGAVLYGLTDVSGDAPTPPLPVHSYRVLPAADVPGDLYAYWLLDRIVDTLRGGDQKLVNLSLGPEVAVEDDQEPNRWTSELDTLSWNDDILFVVAAGNDGEADRATGLHRVQAPADMANGLGVGACDVPPPDHPWTRAPYSSTGPGRPGNWRQPCGVQFGGTDARPFPLLRADGSTHQAASGTSFAAPLVTHALAELAARLPRVNPNVLRAFAVHFAERHRKNLQLLDEVGHGRLPLTFLDSLECEPDDVHVLFVDTIARNEVRGYELPVPEEVTADLDLRLTLAYSSPVEPTQPTEYTQAALELVLRPHQRQFRLRPPPGSTEKEVVLDIAGDEARRLLADGWRPGQEPVTHPLGAAPGASESQLRDAGKWETIRHHRLRLKSTKVSGPRLEVSYVARRGGGLDNSPTEVPFAILASAHDRGGAGKLYDRTTARFAALRPVPRAQGRVRVRQGIDPNSGQWL